MTASALDDVLVLDLSSAVAGAFAGKLLVDLGARVVLVEPAAGSALREPRPVRPPRGRQGVGRRGRRPPTLGRWLAVADVVLTDGSSDVARDRCRGGAADGRRRRPVAVRPVRALRRVGQQRPRHVGDGRLPLLHRGARPRADLGARAAGPAARRHARRVRRAGRPARARAQRPGPDGGGRRPRRRADRARLAGLVVGGVRDAARPPALRPHPLRRRLRLRHADRPQGRAVHHDRAARSARRGPHRRRADVERQHPADLRGRPGVGDGQEGRRRRRARPAPRASP